MFTRNAQLLSTISALTLALAACGGGWGAASIPPPPPPPPPSSPGATLGPSDVVIFPAPTAQTFASVGVAATDTGKGFTGLTTADSDQLHIRYSSGGYYEVQMPGASWDKLDFAKGSTPADPQQALEFQPESASQTGAHLIIRGSREDGYKYSEQAYWYDGQGEIGELAFGSATASGQVPLSGSATYAGVVKGISDAFGDDLTVGNFPLSVDGTVTLSFDFSKGSLSGSMTAYLPDGMQPLEIGQYAFKDTVFSAGSTTYSGKFDTAASGANYFLGQFTGPNAQETIGAWALPFVFDKSGQTITADGKTHQAFGAWIAKKP